MEADALYPSDDLFSPFARITRRGAKREMSLVATILGRGGFFARDDPMSKIASAPEPHPGGVGRPGNGRTPSPDSRLGRIFHERTIASFPPSPISTAWKRRRAHVSLFRHAARGWRSASSPLPARPSGGANLAGGRLQGGCGGVIRSMSSKAGNEIARSSEPVRPVRSGDGASRSRSATAFRAGA